MLSFESHSLDTFSVQTLFLHPSDWLFLSFQSTEFRLHKFWPLTKEKPGLF